MANKLLDIDLEEVSVVDKGSNPGAHIVLMKRDIEKATKREEGEDFPAAAYAYVPDREKPSTWKLRLWDSLDTKETAPQVGRALAAIGPGFRGQKVEIPSEDMGAVKNKILAAWRKTHSSDAEVPSILKKEQDMNVEDLVKRFEDMEAKLAKFDEEVKELKTENTELKVENEGLKAQIAESSSEDSSVEKKDDIDTELKKRDDKIEILTKRLEMSELSKRVEIEYPNIPGEAADKANLLKSLESIEDEAVRNMGLGILKSHNDSLGEAMKEIGKGGGKDTTAADELDNMAKSYASEHSISFSKAYNHILTTPEGKELYAKTLSH